jgi:hypothetical protein
MLFHGCLSLLKLLFVHCGRRGYPSLLSNLLKLRGGGMPLMKTIINYIYRGF